MTIESPAPTVTTTSRRWKLKMGVFTLLLLGFGVWGYYDAMVVYPRRGNRASLASEAAYLSQMKERGALDRRASVEDPTAEYARLRGEKSSLDARDRALFEWLDGLDTLGRLRPEFTKIPRTDAVLNLAVDDARGRLEQLSSLTITDKPLAKWDIPSQWLICAAGLLGGLYLLGLMAAVLRRRYSWDASAQALTLPGGARLTPGDVAQFDKRKWDKFLVSLHVKPGHPQLGGKSVELDLYRHEPLEEWVLAMEKAAHPPGAGGAGAESGGVGSEQH